MSQQQTFRRACLTSWSKNIPHIYDMKKLRHCHRMYGERENYEKGKPCPVNAMVGRLRILFT